MFGGRCPRKGGGSRLLNFVEEFPNLGVRGGGEILKIDSGAKKRLRESGLMNGNLETMGSGGSPAKVLRYDRLPGIKPVPL